MAGFCIMVRGKRFVVLLYLTNALDSAVLHHGPGDLHPSLRAYPISVLRPYPTLRSLVTAPNVVLLGINVCPYPRSLYFLGAVEGSY